MKISNRNINRVINESIYSVLNEDSMNEIGNGAYTQLGQNDEGNNGGGWKSWLLKKGGQAALYYFLAKRYGMDMDDFKFLGNTVKDQALGGLGVLTNAVRNAPSNLWTGAKQFGSMVGDLFEDRHVNNVLRESIDDVLYQDLFN